MINGNPNLPTVSLPHNVLRAEILFPTVNRVECGKMIFRWRSASSRSGYVSTMPGAGICTPHSAYVDADLDGKPVVDVWGFLKNANVVISA